MAYIIRSRSSSSLRSSNSRVFCLRTLCYFSQNAGLTSGSSLDCHPSRHLGAGNILERTGCWMVPQIAYINKIPGFYHGISRFSNMSDSENDSKESMTSKTKSTNTIKQNAQMRKYLNRYRPTQFLDIEKTVAQKMLVQRILDVLEGEGDAKSKLEGLNVRLSPSAVIEVVKKVSVSKAWEFFSWARGHNGFKHDKQTYLVMLRKFKSEKVTEHLSELFENIKSDGCELDATTYIGLMRAYARAGDFDKAMEFWSSLRQTGLKLDTKAYNHVIAFLLNAKQRQQALELYKDMLQAHCAPDAETYHFLIRSLISFGKIESAFTIIRKMPRLGVRPYQPTYTLLINAALKAGNLDTAVGLILHMKLTHRDPDRKLMSKVKKACVAAGKSTELLEQHWEAYFAYSNEPSSGGDTSASGKSDEGTTTGSEFEDTDEDLEVDKGTLASILTPWNPNTALTLKKMGFKWTPRIASYLMKDLEDVDVAFGFFEWLRSVPDFKHDEHTYIKMITILLTARRFVLIDCLLDEMHALGLEVPVWVFNQIVECYSSCRDAEGALKVLAKMEKIGTQPDGAVYTGIIDILMRDGMYQCAMEVYGQMLREGIEPNNFTYSVLVNGLGFAGLAHKARELLDIMKSHGYKPNVITYTALLGGYEKLGQLSNVLQVYKEMQDAGIEPTPITYRVLCQAFYRAGNWEEGEKFEQKLQTLLSSDIGAAVMEQTQRASCKEILETLESLEI